MLVFSGQLANIQGRIIGTNIVGGKAIYQGTVGTGIAKIFGYPVRTTDLSETRARKEALQVVTALVPVLDHAHYYPEAKFVGMKIVARTSTGCILWVQMVDLGDIAKYLDVAAAAITRGTTVTKMSQFDLGSSLPYSVAVNLLVNAAQVVGNKLTEVA